MEVITVTNLSNREFLETHALPGRIGLTGGRTLINKALSRAQRHVDPMKHWSQWAHAFIFQGKRHDGQHWIIESDLQVFRKHIQLGVQENRIDKLWDESNYGTLAVLDFNLTPEQVNRLLSEALELVATRVRYSMRELVGTLIALKHPSLRSKPNALAREKSFYCSAFVRHLFVKAGVDLAPGLDIKNTTPEDLWRTVTPHTTHVLQRKRSKSHRIAKFRAGVRKRLKRRKRPE
jgi:hypothetical protein